MLINMRVQLFSLGITTEVKPYTWPETSPVVISQGNGSDFVIQHFQLLSESLYWKVVDNFIFYPFQARRGHTGMSGRVQTERKRQDLGHMPLVACLGAEPWSTWAMARSVSSSQKKEVLVSPLSWGGWVFSKGCIRHTKALGGGRLLITRAVGEVISGGYICL